MNRDEQAAWKEIAITEIEGFRIGNVQDMENMTGVTVILFDGENRGGIDISGGGPAARESHLLTPLTNPHALNALVLPSLSECRKKSAGSRKCRRGYGRCRSERLWRCF